MSRNGSAATPEDSQITVSPQSVIQVSLCLHVRRAARAVTQAFDQALAPIGLTAAQFDLLASVAALDPATVPALAGLLVVDRTTLSRNLKLLKAAGLLDSAGGAGPRAGTLRLTARGLAALRNALPVWQATQRRIIDRIGGGRAGSLLDSLDIATKAAAGG